MLPLYDIGTVITIFTIVCLFIASVILFLSWAVRPLERRKKAEETYECGFKAEGDAKAIGFNYIQYATIFLVFDLAAIYLFLYAALPNPTLMVTTSFFMGIFTLLCIILYGAKRRRYYAA